MHAYCRNEDIKKLMEKTIDESVQGKKLVLEPKPENTKKLFIESYGCAMNFSDSEIVASILSLSLIHI